MGKNAHQSQFLEASLVQQTDGKLKNSRPLFIIILSQKCWFKNLRFLSHYSWSSRVCVIEWCIEQLHNRSDIVINSSNGSCMYDESLG